MHIIVKSTVNVCVHNKNLSRQLSVLMHICCLRLKLFI